MHRHIQRISTGLLVVVDIEKVRVEQSLNDAGHDGDRLEGSLEGGLGEVSVYPIRDIERPVQTQGKQIVRGDCVCLSSALQHEQLGQDCNRFQPNRERPKDLDRNSRQS